MINFEQFYNPSIIREKTFETPASSSKFQDLRFVMNLELIPHDAVMHSPNKQRLPGMYMVYLYIYMYNLMYT